MLHFYHCNDSPGTQSEQTEEQENVLSSKIDYNILPFVLFKNHYSGGEKKKKFLCKNMSLQEATECSNHSSKLAQSQPAQQQRVNSCRITP